MSSSDPGAIVVRTWEGRARPGAEAHYLAHLTDVVIPQIRALEGNRGVQVLQGRAGAAGTFMVLSFWSDETAIGRFAGTDVEAAVVPPEAQALLEAFDERARHFDVVFEDR